MSRERTLDAVFGTPKNIPSGPFLKN